MPPESFERKLAAILSADVAGYSRLMGDDDDATVPTLTGYREMMIHPHQTTQGFFETDYIMTNWDLHGKRVA